MMGEQEVPTNDNFYLHSPPLVHFSPPFFFLYFSLTGDIFQPLDLIEAWFLSILFFLSILVF